MITRQIEIEELVKILPEAVAYLSDKGIRCLRCGEPVWGTLENASKEKGFNDEQISEFEAELNQKLMCKSN
ncbi:MAG: DUF1858 domain-containing protein [Ignavibacteriales bacterium]|nr:DUF1858 domain-containing protein [Ignavibacteriales bacterium]